MTSNKPAKIQQKKSEQGAFGWFKLNNEQGLGLYLKNCLAIYLSEFIMLYIH